MRDHEGLYNSKCKDRKFCLEYVKVKYKLLIFNCLKCNKSHKKYFDKHLVKRLANKYKFCGRDSNKLCLMLRKAGSLRIHG